MKLLLQRRSSGCLHDTIDVCDLMMSFYLCLLMGMSIECQRWLKYCLLIKRVPQKMSSAMKNMFELKYVPCGILTLHCLMVSATNVEKPILDTDWISAGGGRPPIASLDEIKTMADSMECQSGHVWSDLDGSSALSDNHMKNIEESGFISLSQPENFLNQQNRTIWYCS